MAGWVVYITAGILPVPVVLVELLELYCITGIYTGSTTNTVLYIILLLLYYIDYLYI